MGQARSEALPLSPRPKLHQGTLVIGLVGKPPATEMEEATEVELVVEEDLVGAVTEELITAITKLQTRTVEGERTIETLIQEPVVCSHLRFQGLSSVLVL